MTIVVGCTPTPEGVAALDVAEGHAKLVDAQAVLLNSPVPAICVPGQPRSG